jgi:arylsulfatase A-like enzyme/Flp pilus assembly protein TadD
MKRPQATVTSLGKPLISRHLRPPATGRGETGRLAAAALAAAALLFAGCGRQVADGYAAPAGTPVVVVSIDTLRADRLPAYGYDGVETPAIDRLRDDGILYERAYSHVPLTLPAHSSLLTGLLPAAHGLRDNIGYFLDADRVAAGEIPHLPLALRRAGYATGAAVSSYVLRAKMGLDQGFDFYEDSIEFRTGTGLGGLQRPGSETLALSRDWLRENAEEPFFYFFHIYEPHTPYQPLPEFATRYSNPYDAEVASADRIVGELFAELDRLGVYDKAIVILLSDHGEGLGQHGEEEHGVLLYASTLHVPLILKLPEARFAGRAVAAPAQLIDVFPTVAGLLGLEPPAPLSGSSLLRLVDGATPDRRIYAETFYPRLHFGWSELTALFDDRHQYIHGPDPEIYDLVADPAQRDNLTRRRGRLAATLRGELEGFDRSLADPAGADEETRQALAALGYIGTVGTVDDDVPLADPKSRLGTLADLKAGFRYQSQKDSEKAAAAFERALVDNPQMLDAWESLARARQRLGRTEEALAAYKRALEISDGSPHLAISAASLLFDLRRLDEAEAHARLALGSNPSFAHGLLAQIALERVDLGGRRIIKKLALDEKNPRLGPTITLAAVLHARHRYDEALEMTRATERTWAGRKQPDPELIRGLFLQRGRILADLGRAGEAEAAFQREIELFQRDLGAWSNLAVLYALSGRGAEVGAVLRRMVEVNDSADAYAEAVRTLRVVEDRSAAAALLRFARARFPGSEELRELERG